MEYFLAALRGQTVHFVNCKRILQQTENRFDKKIEAREIKKAICRV